MKPIPTRSHASSAAIADEEPARCTTRRRAFVLGLMQLGGLGLLAGRMHQLQIVDGPHYMALAEANRLEVSPIAPRRGRILDRAGRVLAADSDGWRVTLTPADSPDLPTVLARLASQLSLTEEDLRRVIHRARRQPRTQPVVVATDLERRQALAVLVDLPHLPGVACEPFGRRRYWYGARVGLAIGMVGGIVRPALDDDPVLRGAGLRAGRSGIELGAEAVLRGTAGRRELEVDARGRTVRELRRIEPVPGKDVISTLDADLQGKMLQHMAGVDRGALVAVDVETGRVTALVSKPNVDPQAYLAGIARDRDAVTGAVADTEHDGDPLFNRAIQGLYAPGSVLKPVTALAALEAGAVDVMQEIECTGSVEFAGQVFRCWRRDGHGMCDLERALAESCDCYFYEVARRIGIVRLSAMARLLGLGQSWPAGIGQLGPGVVPDEGWKQARLGHRWTIGDTVQAGIGQGYTLATPLQLAVMTARLASGRAVAPTFLMQPAPGHAAPLEVAPAHLDAVRAGMLAAVEGPNGTGRRARLEELGGIAGKTGTSQVSRRTSERSQFDLPWHLRDHALFIAYAPSEAPRDAVALVVEHGGSGGGVAAPIVRDVLADLAAYRHASDAPASEAGDGGTDAPAGGAREG